MICYGNAFSVTTLWITCVISLMEGRDFTGGWHNLPGSIKARAVEPASASEMKQPRKGMPEIWPCDAASLSLWGNMVTYGNEMPTPPDFQIPAQCGWSTARAGEKRGHEGPWVASQRPTSESESRSPREGRAEDSRLLKASSSTTGISSLASGSSKVLKARGDLTTLAETVELSEGRPLHTDSLNREVYYTPHAGHPVRRLTQSLPITQLS